MNNIKTKFSSHVRSILKAAIPYEIRNILGDWSPYFGQYEGQKHDDLDSNCCWAFAGNECLEDSLEYLWKTNQFTDETKKWFTDNGYIDSDGDFYLSRRFVPIISGVEDNGNDQAEFWRLTEKYGAIPNSKLPYTNNGEYFDKNKLTQAMYALGKEFLKRVNITDQEIGRRFNRKDLKQLQEALFQGELQIGVSVPFYSSWNQVKIKWEGNEQPAHSVACYKVDEKADYDYPIFIYDQYEPHLKQLSRDYFISLCSQGVVTAKVQKAKNTVPQDSLGARIWKAIHDYFIANPLWISS